jgi:hypothetical protein
MQERLTDVEAEFWGLCVGDGPIDADAREHVRTNERLKVPQ